METNLVSLDHIDEIQIDMDGVLADFEKHACEILGVDKIVDKKAMWKAIKAHIKKFQEENNIIKESQHGFMHEKSCLKNLLEFLDKITKGFDDHNPVDAIYHDFSKAFDKVPHRRLIC